MPEELIEQEDPAEVVVERVLCGESDSGQDLLAVAGGRPGSSPRQSLRRSRHLLRWHFPRRGQDGVRRFDGHKGVGQAVPDRLERS